MSQRKTLNVNTDGDPFIDEMMEVLSGDYLDEWDSWYAEHGGRPGVVFKGPNGGIGIPSMLDSLRYDAYKQGGLEAMREFDAKMARGE